MTIGNCPRGHRHTASQRNTTARLPGKEAQTLTRAVVGQALGQATGSCACCSAPDVGVVFIYEVLKLYARVCALFRVCHLIKSY